MSALIPDAVKQLTANRDDYADTARQFLDAGDHKQAVRFAKLQLKENRERAAGWYLSEFRSVSILAQAYLKQGFFESTVRELSKAIRIRPKEAKLYIVRGNIYRLHLDRPQEAIEDISKGLSLDDSYIQGYVYRSAARFFTKDYQGALDDCQVVLARGNFNAITHNVMGDVYSALEQYEVAIDEYNNAIKVDPLYGRSYVVRACAYNAIDRSTEALADVSMALELGYDELFAHHQKAIALFGLGRSEETLIEIAKCAVPEYPSGRALFCYINGAIALKAGSSQESLEQLSLALDFVPKEEVSLRAGILRSRSENYCKLGDYRSAFADADAAIELRPKNAKSYFLRGRASTELGQFELAVEDYSKALQLDASMTKALWYRAEALINSGRRMSAKADYERYEFLEGEDEP